MPFAFGRLLSQQSALPAASRPADRPSPRRTPGLAPCALAAALAVLSATCNAQSLELPSLEPLIESMQPRMVEWRRDIHEHPELSGQEVRTARLVADHLRKLGLEVRTGVGGHGVVGVLKGGAPGGKVVALRADMDALPVAEATGLRFASRATGLHMGRNTPVMHACGHDGHTAILMAVAEVLADARARLPGTVKFIFQPAEEGVSDLDASGNQPGTQPSWGARAMVEQGALQRPRVDAMFGLHLSPNLPAGTVGYRPGPMMAGADTVHITITGRQTHGAAPWTGVDPIVAAAHVVSGLQTIISRQLNISKEAAVLTIGAIHGGNRENIIPDTVEMLGTLRTFDEDMRSDAKQRIVTMAESIAKAHGAQAKVRFGPATYSVTVNPPTLTEAMLPTLQRVTGGQAMLIPKISASEDFSEYQKVVPAMFYILGAPPRGKAPEEAAPNHSPAFDFDEDAMTLGARSLIALTLDYLNQR